MNNKKMFWAVLVVVFVAGIISAGCLNANKINKQSKEPINIGIMTPLTGDAAVWGLEVKNGVEIAYDEIKNVTIDGRKINLVFEDDQCDGKTSLSAIQKLISVNKAKIIAGTVCSSVVLATAPVTEENKVIQLSAGASNPAITNAGDYIFRIWPSDTFEGKALADFAANDLGIKKVGILYLNNEYGTGLRDAFKNELEKNGGKVVIMESFDPNANDFRTQLTKIKNEDIDAIYFASNPTEAPLILKEIKEMGINKTILANGPAMEAVDTINKSGKAAEGVYYAQSKQETSEEFKEKYKKKFGKDAGFASDLGYDVVMLSFNAIKHCNGDNTDCIRDYLYGVKNYNGASGLITFDKNGDVIKPFVIKEVVNGTAVVVKEI